MTTINCNHSNDTFNDNEWNRIQAQCIKQKHIKPNDNLKQIIKTDEETLANLCITFDQLKDFFFVFKLYVKKYGIDKSAEYLMPEFVKKFWSDKTDNFFSLHKGGWCSWGSYSYQFNMFGTNYFVSRITWGGAETCPFQHPEDKRYHGYEYGSHDWLIWNLDNESFMHIGDLLFHQIVTHHFFQSPESAYRIDPLKLIQHFNLKPNIVYKVDTKEVAYAYDRCCSTDSPLVDNILYTYNIKEQLVTNENYKLSIVTEQSKHNTNLKNDSKSREMYFIELLNKDYAEPIIYNSIIFRKSFCPFSLYDIEPRIVTELV